jgi:hypothetical protein
MATREVILEHIASAERDCESKAGDEEARKRVFRLRLILWIFDELSKIEEEKYENISDT